MAVKSPVFLVGLVLAGSVWLVQAQNLRPSTQNPRSNPLARDPAAVQVGRVLYLSDSTRCAVCHGRDGRAGGEAPDLYRSRLVLRGSDERLFDVVKNGIQGSGMPAQSLSEDQIWQLVSYLQSLARPGLQPPVPGDPVAGKVVFGQMGCWQCHMIRGAGGALGPDLSSVALRNAAEDIRKAVLDPNIAVRDGFKTVTVITQSGERITGLLKNEDNFSIQIMKVDGEYGLFLRNELHEIVYQQHSLMPSGYYQKMSEEQLQNLLAYLDRQRAGLIGAEMWLIKPH